MAQTRNITLAKVIISHIFTLSLAGALKVTFNGNRSVVGETAKNITLKWSINLTDKSIITLIQASVQLQSSKKAELVLENTSTGKQVVTEYGKKIYGNRLLADLIDNKFTLKLTNAQYNDSGSYSINVISRTPLVEADDAVTVLVYGRPEMCVGNNTNGSQLTYTICGVPMPKVAWGLTKISINKSINATERTDLFYAYDYSLSLKPDMCEKVLYFDAVGYKNITISWSEKVKKDYSPTNVTGVKVKGRKISWNKLTFINCKPKHEFNILFKNESTSILKHTTSSTSFQCDSRCTKATMFDIWAVVDGVNWTITNFPLNVTNFLLPKVDKGATSSSTGSGDGNDTGDGSGNDESRDETKSEEEDESTIVYILIAALVGIILLIIILISMHRYQTRKSGQRSSGLELEPNIYVEAHGEEQTGEEHPYDDINEVVTPEEISAIRNIAGNNSMGTADYINVNNSQNPEEQVTLYEAPTGASAQYAKVNKIQIQQYAQVDKSKKNNAPLYAHVNRILNRDSHNYEPLSQPNKSHYADIETTNTNRPPKMEKMEPNYIEVEIRDDPDDESPPK